MPARYPLDRIKALAAAGDLLLANARAARNATELGWTIGMISSFVGGLTGNHHRGVRPALSIFDGRETIDCDKYVARFDEDAMKVTRDANCCGFFVELAVKDLPAGTTVLVVSIHLDGQP